jgi:hypothetical protein
MMPWMLGLLIIASQTELHKITHDKHITNRITHIIAAFVGSKHCPLNTILWGRLGTNLVYAYDESFMEKC